jgi:GcrA cell cycle regulator
VEWSDERVQQLKDMWAKGLSARQIAESLGSGVTRNAVIGKAHRIGLSQPSPAKIKPKPAMVAMVSDRGCRWPIGHPGETGFHFCGSQASPGRPYCNSHCAVAYRNKDEAAA